MQLASAARYRHKSHLGMEFSRRKPFKSIEMAHTLAVLQVPGLSRGAVEGL